MMLSRIMILRMLFQLTTSRRGRLRHLGMWILSSYFNSLPHAEVDYDSYGILRRIHISTHYLTQR